MSNDISNEALELLNQGVDAAIKGNRSQAIENWKTAIELNPLLELEIMIRRNLAKILFQEIIGLSEGSSLTMEQAKDFSDGEECANRLRQLCSDENTENHEINLEPKTLEDCRNAANDCFKFTMMAGLGWFIFPGDETPRRMIESGMALADLGKKDEALHPLKEALNYLDINNENHKKLALISNLRIAVLLSDLGHKKEASKHAKQAILLGLNDPSDTMYIMMKVIIGSAGEKVPESAKQRGCFIATAVYGSPDCDNVIILKSFRDNILLTSKLGRSFVNFYYDISPSIANVIYSSNLLRKTIRNIIVLPLVILSKHLLYFRKDR